MHSIQLSSSHRQLSLRPKPFSSERKNLKKSEEKTHKNHRQAQKYEYENIICLTFNFPPTDPPTLTSHQKFVLKTKSEKRSHIKIERQGTHVAILKFSKACSGQKFAIFGPKHASYFFKHIFSCFVL